MSLNVNPYCKPLKRWKAEAVSQGPLKPLCVSKSGLSRFCHRYQFDRVNPFVLYRCRHDCISLFETDCEIPKGIYFSPYNSIQGMNLLFLHLKINS